MNLSRPDRWMLIPLSALALILFAAIGIIPSMADRPTMWRTPGREIPRDGASVEAVYARMVDGKAELFRDRVVYQARLERHEGRDYPVEDWIHDDGEGGAAPDMGRPIYWATPEEAEVLALPELPDLFLAALARRRK